MTDHLGEDGPRFQRPPTGPWVAPPRGVPPRPPAQQRSAATCPSVYQWRRLASVICFTAIIASIGVRAYRDLSGPDGWSYLKDLWVSPSLTSARISNVDIDHSGHGRAALAISGEIGPAAASWLRDRIDEAHLTKGDVVLLSSPGGNVYQAMIMGEVIRARGLATAVGVADDTGHVSAAHCASACVMAYAGGSPRFGVEHSALGVHRFTTTDEMSDPVAYAQRMTGTILSYMTKMGVSARVVEAMSATRKIHWLDDQDALAMNLVTAPVRAR